MSKPTGYVVVRHAKNGIADGSVVNGRIFDALCAAEMFAGHIREVVDDGRHPYVYTVEPVGAAPTDAGLREAAQALVDKLAKTHGVVDYTGIQPHEEYHALRAALSQRGGG